MKSNTNNMGTQRKIKNIYATAIVNKCGRIKESGLGGKLKGIGKVELIDSPIPCGPVQA